MTEKSLRTTALEDAETECGEYNCSDSDLPWSDDSDSENEIWIWSSSVQHQDQGVYIYIYIYLRGNKQAIELFLNIMG